MHYNILKTCYKGEMIGSTGEVHDFTAKSKGTTTIYFIKKEILENILRENNFNN